MEGNNLNQNNQVGSTNTGISVNQGPIMSNQNYVQYNDFNQNNILESNNPHKKNNGPLVIFGVIFLIAIVLVVTLLLENKEETGVNDNKLINENTKTLVVYFSKDGENYGRNLNIEKKVNLPEGNTKVMAEKIASFINADLYEIEPLNPYPEDLNELYATTKTEYNKDIYPEIKTKVNNLDNYDVIFIGYPIWHASFPQIIKTFVRDNKSILKNKIIVPFNTHAGSGSAGTYKKLFNLIENPENKQFNGLAINGAEVNNSDDAIKKWLVELDYSLK